MNTLFLIVIVFLALINTVAAAVAVSFMWNVILPRRFTKSPNISQVNTPNTPSGSIKPKGAQVTSPANLGNLGSRKRKRRVRKKQNILKG